MIMWGKYIVIEHMGHEIAILFHNLIEHSQIARDMKVISAGLFVIDIKNREIVISVFGKSGPLDKEARKGIDEKLIREVVEGTKI